MNGVEYTYSNQECKIGYKNFTNGVSQYLIYLGNLETFRDQLDHNRSQHKGKKTPLGSCVRGFQL